MGNSGNYVVAWSSVLIRSVLLSRMEETQQMIVIFTGNLQGAVRDGAWLWWCGFARWISGSLQSSNLLFGAIPRMETVFEITMSIVWFVFLQCVQSIGCLGPFLPRPLPCACWPRPWDPEGVMANAMDSEAAGGGIISCWLPITYALLIYGKGSMVII